MELSLGPGLLVFRLCDMGNQNGVTGRGPQHLSAGHDLGEKPLSVRACCRLLRIPLLLS